MPVTGSVRYRMQRNYGCRIHDEYTYFGMRTIVMENELVRISILADKGTDIFEFVYKSRDVDLMWLTTNGVQNPNDYLSTAPNPIANFMDYYEGGWQEVFPNGGPTSRYLGAEFGQHGEVAQMPWDYKIIEDTPELIKVQFEVATKKSPCRIRKTLILRSQVTTLEIEEIIKNESHVNFPYMWGHHLAYGKPFLRPGCYIRLPKGIVVLTDYRSSKAAAPGRVKRCSSQLWPIVEGENGRLVDLSLLPLPGSESDVVYLTGFPNDAWYEVENKELSVGVRVEWDGVVLPYLWFWQEFGATTGYPWYGRHYNIGLEPFSSFPTAGLEEAIQNGTARILPGDAQIALHLRFTPYRLG